MNNNLRELVGSVLDSYRTEPVILKIEAKDRINNRIVVGIIEKLQMLIFAGFFAHKPLKNGSIDYYVGELMEEISYDLEKQLSRAIRHRKEAAPYDGEAKDLTYIFLSKIPAIRSKLATDVEAAFDGDPSAFSYDEIILSYPGLYATAIHRIAHELYILDVPLIPRMMSEYAHEKTGIDIHPGATIGHHFFVDHGTGIVIGETAEIGDYVKIYQGVTLGALSTRAGQMLSGVKRHPTIENHVVIYSGASILGGTTIIGEGSVIGSNAFITRSVPDKTRVSVKNPELQFKNSTGNMTVAELELDEAWFYSI